MTDTVALLINLVTLAESGDTSFKLQISRTYYDPEDFTPRKNVLVDGVQVGVLEFDDLITAAKDWPVLEHATLEKYMPPKRPAGMPRSVSKGYCE